MILFRWLGGVLLGAVVTILVLLALLVSLGRVLLPELNQHRTEVLSYLNEQLPFSVQAGQLNGKWQRWSPTIVAHDLVLGSGEDALQLDRARVTLNIADTLWHRKLVFQQLEVDGLELALSESQDGRWKVLAEWLPQSEKPVRWLSLDALYSGLNLLTVSNSEVTLLRANGRQIAIDQIDLRYLHDDNHWRVRSVGRPDASPKAIAMVAEGTGLPTQQAFSVRAHTEVDGFDATPYLTEAMYQGWVATVPHFDGDLWLEYHRGGALNQGGLQIEGVIDLQDIRFNHDTGKQGIDIPALQTQFKFLLGADGTPSVWLRDLQLRLKEEDIAFKHANLVPVDDGLQASFDAIEVNPVLRLLRRFEILPDKAQEVLATLDPRGLLQDITLSIPAEGAIEDVKVAASLRDIGVRPWKGAPGVTNLSGYVFADTRSGLVQVDSKSLSTYFPKLFHHPMSFDTAVGPIEWEIKGKVVEVRSGTLDLVSEAGHATASVGLFLPIKKEYGMTPLMDLQIQLANSEAKYRDGFIPYTLDPGLLKWLQRSIVKSRVDEAAFLYRGSLEKYAQNRRTMQLFIDADEAEVDYHNSWPSGRDLSASIFVDDATVFVEANAGSMSGLDIGDARIRYVPEPGKKGGNVIVKSDLKGSVSNAMAFLSNSPLRKNLGTFLDDWEATGTLSGMVDTTIPIGLDSKEKVYFRSRVQGARIKNEELRIEVANLNGPLRYSSEKGLHSEGLVGTLWGESLSANIESKQEAAEDGGAAVWQTTAQLRGSNRADAVVEWLDEPLQDFVDGEFEFAAELKLGGVKDSSLTIMSQLRGLESTLPPPFNKSSLEERPISLNFYLAEQPLRMRVQLADTLQAAMVLNKNEPLTGMLSFNRQSEPTYAKDGIRLVGALDEFDLGRTLDVITAYSEAAGTSKRERKQMSVYAQDLRLRKTKAFNNDFGMLKASIATHDESWTFAFDGARVAGRASYDASRLVPLDLSLDRLYLQTDQQTEGDDGTFTAGVGMLDNFYPADLPVMRFNLADLQVNKKQFGRWSFETAEIKHGAIFRNLQANSRGMTITGREEQPAILRWKRVGDQQQTEFDGVLECADMGAVLEAWDYAPAIRSKSCRFDTAVSWFGSPLDPSMAQMAGDVDIFLTNGKFLETNSTANALRLFSLFNFDTLLRRLQFRFDDVFKRGMSYDEITGGFNLSNGTLDIETPFEVKGPSSRLQMTGSLDLVNETVDTRMVATLPISSNLPWVAALAGGLPVAAGVYVAGKIFQKPIEKLSSASYEVKGSWDEPDIKLQRIFDDDAKQPGQAGSEAESGPLRTPDPSPRR